MMRLAARTLLAIWLALMVAATPGLAQDQPSQQDYTHWEEVAKRAEQTIAGTSASDLALNALRSELARYRTIFQNAGSINADRIKTAEEQLAALGPAPESGQTEAADIAKRRQELNDQLAQLKAPGLKAQQAYEKANGLIREVDALIRSRQTARLLERGPMPLNPANWVEGLGQVGGVMGKIGDELRTSAANPATRTQFEENLPAIFALTLIGLIGLVYGGRGARRASALVVEKVGERLRGPLLLAASLLRVVLPLIGTYALIEAVTLSGIPGFRSAYIIEIIPAAAMLVVGGYWLGAEVFPPGPRGPAALFLPEGVVAGGRRSALLVSLAFAALLLVERLDRFSDFTDATTAVLAFVPLLLAALGLWSIARLIRTEGRTLKAAAEGAEPPNRVSIAFRSILWRLTLAVAWIGPLLAAVGYRQAGLALVFPMAMTLALIVAVRILQAFVSDIYVILTRSGHEARDGLVPVLLSLILVIAALPLLAVIWGARWVDLGELWSQISGGFTIGSSRITFADVLSLVMVFTLGYIATRALQATLRVQVLPKTRIDVGARNALVSGIGYIGIFLAGLIAITTTGIDLSSLAIVAGALSVGIGFGLQNIVSNFVSGVILLIERPISEGDWIEVGSNMGIVKSISVRSTRIETFDRTDVIIPNQDLVSGTVTNWTRGNTIGRLTIDVGVAYGTDTRRVEAILLEVAKSHDVTLSYPPPVVTFNAFGADSLEFKVRIYLRDVNKILQVKSEMNHEIAHRFREAGIEIPFAQRDIWLRNPEALRAPPAHTTPAADPPSTTAPVQTAGDGRGNPDGQDGGSQ